MIHRTVNLATVEGIRVVSEVRSMIHLRASPVMAGMSLVDQQIMVNSEASAPVSPSTVRVRSKAAIPEDMAA